MYCDGHVFYGSDVRTQNDKLFEESVTKNTQNTPQCIWPICSISQKIWNIFEKCPYQASIVRLLKLGRTLHFILYRKTQSRYLMLPQLQSYTFSTTLKLDRLKSKLGIRMTMQCIIEVHQKSNFGYF